MSSLPKIQVESPAKSQVYGIPSGAVVAQTPQDLTRLAMVQFTRLVVEAEIKMSSTITMMKQARATISDATEHMSVVFPSAYLAGASVELTSMEQVQLSKVKDVLNQFKYVMAQVQVVATDVLSSVPTLHAYPGDSGDEAGEESSSDDDSDCVIIDKSIARPPLIDRSSTCTHDPCQNPLCTGFGVDKSIDLYADVEELSSEQEPNSEDMAAINDGTMSEDSHRSGIDSLVSKCRKMDKANRKKKKRRRLIVVSESDVTPQKRQVKRKLVLTPVP
jgi:hypothetical protein